MNVFLEWLNADVEAATLEKECGTAADSKCLCACRQDGRKGVIGTESDDADASMAQCMSAACPSKRS